VAVLGAIDVRSADMFRTELAVSGRSRGHGLLAYNLVRMLMAPRRATLVKAAVRANLKPAQLSFTRCLRRILQACTHGFPAWVYEEYADPMDFLLEQLSKCRKWPVRGAIAQPIQKS